MSENLQDPTAPGDQPQQQPYTPPPPPPPAPPPPPPPPPGDQAPAYGQPAPTYGQQAPAYGQPAPAYGQQGQAPVSPSDARMWALFAQIGGIFFSFVPALVIYVVFKDRDPFIRRHAAQALNFQIILAIAYVISFILLFVVIGIFTFIAAGICAIVFPILAAVAANKGEEYTYPLTPQIIT